jgi:hypothetical protein
MRAAASRKKRFRNNPIDELDIFSLVTAIYVVCRIQMVRQKGSLTKRMDLE